MQLTLAWDFLGSANWPKSGNLSASAFFPNAKTDYLILN